MPPLDFPADRDWYLKEFMNEIDRQVPRLSGFRRQEADDLRSSMCLWLIERPHLMAAYHPRALAATSIRQRAVDFYRSMTRQLPQGRFDPEIGSLTNPLMWLDASASSGPYSDDAGPHGSSEVSPAMAWTAASGEDQVVHTMMLGALLTNLSPRQKQVFVLVDLDGYTVVHAARTLGVRREWAQRALGQARQAVRSSPEYR